MQAGVNWLIWGETYVVRLIRSVYRLLWLAIVFELGRTIVTVLWVLVGPRLHALVC